MRSKVEKQGRLMQIFSAPIKILSKVQNIYVKGMEDCASRMGYGAAIGYSSAPIVSEACDVENLRQLLRGKATRNMEIKLNSNVRNIKRMKQTTSQMSGKAKSYSVKVGKIGRIDENKPCSFDEDDLKALLFYPRSRSHVVRSHFLYQQRKIN